MFYSFPLSFHAEKEEEEEKKKLEKIKSGKGIYKGIYESVRNLSL